jgi:hypothetical protein
MIGKGILILVGIASILVGLFLTLLVIGMFQHPGGIGAEKFFGPILGFVALGLSFLGGICFYAASRINKPPS